MAVSLHKEKIPNIGGLRFQYGLMLSFMSLFYSLTVPKGSTLITEGFLRGPQWPYCPEVPLSCQACQLAGKIDRLLAWDCVSSRFRGQLMGGTVPLLDAAPHLCTPSSPMTSDLQAAHRSWEFLSPPKYSLSLIQLL